MAGGALALQEAGGAEHERSGADRCEIARPGGETPGLAHEGRVVDRRGHPEAAGEENQIAMVDVGKPPRAGEDEPAFRLDRPAGLGRNQRLGVRNAAEHRVGRGEVELRHGGIDRLDDAERRAGHLFLLGL